jgi:hypothetical protein
LVYSENPESYVERGRGLPREYYDGMSYYGNMANNNNNNNNAGYVEYIN